ncbi:endonuclease/exonuclease/phosphatase family protein [Microbacterium sp. NPDC076911]|uniref:endonuclease/exonuclease/phosphatase family protein n=1 Tax=Microbacterium sp. NPDC076911 TaxID=3154958 RepID=UPI003429E7E0
MSSPNAGTSRRGPRRRWLIIWTAVAVVISVGAAMLPYLDIRGISAIPVAQALVPLGAVVLLLLGITSLAFRAWVAALVLLIGAVISGAPALTPLHSAQASCETGAPLTVLSFNAKLAGASPTALAELVRKTEPNAVVLLETDETLIEAVLGEHELAKVLPHRTREVSPGAANGSVILSAYPLSLKENIPGSEFDQVSAVTTLPGGSKVRLAAVHPPPPVWQPNGWYSGIEDIAMWANQTPEARVVIAGDFNASFAHPVLRRMASGLRSAAEAAGPIPWATWPEEKPVPAFTAIDHVFARGATPAGWDSFYVEGSDHRAVLAQWNICA